jgi:hypothetical protein
VLSGVLVFHIVACGKAAGLRRIGVLPEDMEELERLFAVLDTFIGV